MNYLNNSNSKIKLIRDILNKPKIYKFFSNKYTIIGIPITLFIGISYYTPGNNFFIQYYIKYYFSMINPIFYYLSNFIRTKIIYKIKKLRFYN